MTTQTTAHGRPLVWFAAFTVACLAAAAAYVVFRVAPADRSGRTSTAGGAPLDSSSAEWRRVLDDIRSRPHVYYRSVRGTEFGRIVVGSLDAPNERRVVTDLVCDRIDFGRQRGLCLVDNRGRLGPPGLARIVDRNFRSLGTLDLAGLPIRARLSPDERYAAATVFVTGERYDSDFTTRTTIIDMQTGTVIGDLERFVTLRNDRAFSRVDFNFWGVTFSAESHRFHATLGSAGGRFLVEGDIHQRQMRVLRENVECPSLSPDQQHLVFKSRVPDSREWRLHVLELAGGKEWSIANENRSIDDQVEWLDEGHVLYQFVATRGLPEDAMHVWMSSITPDNPTPPRVYIRAANSPAVVRP